MDDDPVCGQCGSSDYSPEVSLILLEAPGLEKPYALLPAEAYQHCTQCSAVYALISKAQDAHPVCREAGAWTRALVVYVDLTGGEVKARGAGQHARA